MQELIAVFEILKKWEYFLIKKKLRKGLIVWIIEPFYAFHHKRGMHLFPHSLPEFVDRLINEKRIDIINASQLNTKDIFHISNDKAVEVIESVFPDYKEEHHELFDCVSNILKSPDAENVFKKDLCNRLAEFYSVNILLHRIEKMFSTGPILFYPDTNVRDYLYFKSLLSKSKQDYYEHPNIRFPIKTQITAFFENLKEYLVSVAKLSAQTIASSFLRILYPIGEKKKKSYLYGVTVTAPLRQLTDNQRGPGFIIDNNKIHAEEVVYLPIIELTGDQKKNLEKIPGSVCYLPKPGRLFSHFNEWKNMLWLALKNNPLRSGREISMAGNALFNYFRWKKVMEDVEIKHFISHCDFSIEQIGRNIALSQAGVQTWYFTDSMNHGCVLKAEKEKCGMRLPFWTYLSYDHLITWNELLRKYFKDHPGSFRQIHVVGCLWAGHIRGKEGEKGQNPQLDSAKLTNKFIISAFDTTYTRNGFTSYSEGIAFANHLLKLADEYPDIHIFVKEKKNRDIHHTLDPVNGPALLNLYKKMGDHPRIKTSFDNEDSSKLISIADMVVSFPFTSTTFEALSVNKPAVWHDPMGYYRDTPYAKVGGVTTHSYEEMKAKVLEIKNMRPGTYQNPIEMGSSLMDPYRDGKAIERFRELLVTYTMNELSEGEEK